MPQASMRRSPSSGPVFGRANSRASSVFGFTSTMALTLIVLLLAWLVSALGQRHDRVHTWLAADDAGDVALARQVFGQHHVAGLDPLHRAVADLDLGGPRERDRVLASRRTMPVEHVARRRGAECDPRRRLRRSRLAVSALDVV